MDGEGFGTAAEASNWEVYKDAFAPPAPSRRVKAWERAPVSAHAPRLQGQRVWKKVGLKTQTKVDDKENLGHEAAQKELERSGMGARKKPRMRGGNKEDISDALWKSGMLEQENGLPAMSPKKQRMSMGPGDMDAFVVPRKRTNANHLITPRKPGRKVPLMEHMQATITSSTQQNTLTQSPTKLSPQKILLDGQEMAQDGVKSPTKASPQKILLNDLNQNEDEVTEPVEKPARRRKSLRRSTRRLTRGTTPEQPPAAPAEAVLANSGLATTSVEASVTDTEALEALPALTELDGPVSACVLHEGAIPASTQELARLEDAEVSTPKSQHKAHTSVESSSITPTAVADVLDEKGQAQQQEMIQLHTPSTSHEAQPSTTVDSATTIEDPFSTALSETLEPKHPVLNSIEIGTETQFTSPIKSSGTPRQKRKTPQRRGSRRSARSARANSVPPEDQPDRDALESQNPGPASSPIKPRTVKTPTKKSRKSTVHATEATDDASAQPAMNQEDEPKLHASKHTERVESAENDNIVTTQPSDITSQPGDIDILERVTETPSPTSKTEGEDRELAQEELSGAAIINTQENVSFEISTTAAPAPTENERVFSPLKASQSKLAQDFELASEKVREGSVEAFEKLEPISICVPTGKLLEDSIEEPADELPESSTPNPSTTELVEAISENAPANTFDHDDTDMLRNFLTRVKANKAAKAGTSIPKRKRSLPHSPIRLPLESVDDALSPSSPKSKDEFDVSLPAHLAVKRKQEDVDLNDDEGRELKSIRRSGRTRLPVKAVPLAAPSFIPVRRLGQDGDNTVTLRRNEEKEIAALTRVNTRKNKGGAQLPMQVLAKQAEEKEDPASRQRALKEAFDEKAQRQKKGKKRKTVIWAEEIAQFQTEEGKTVELEKEPEKEKEKPTPVEEKKTAVKVGVRSKMALGMAVNGTPAPKRKMRGRP
ncbi:hypothetical protein N431DRAFT_548897 [Stipitochalara longipes BDJ]|nr:hypothetical protein N431DRAFT_548897 [Stipitochalara longipes BDJ]